MEAMIKSLPGFADTKLWSPGLKTDVTSPLLIHQRVKLQRGVWLGSRDTVSGPGQSRLAQTQPTVIKADEGGRISEGYLGDIWLHTGPDCS